MGEVRGEGGGGVCVCVCGGGWGWGGHNNAHPEVTPTRRFETRSGKVCVRSEIRSSVLVFSLPANVAKALTKMRIGKA